MGRYLLSAVAIALALAASGCLRQNFDLCAEDPPHPDCALLDAAAPDASDGATSDAALDGGS